MQFHIDPAPGVDTSSHASYGRLQGSLPILAREAGGSGWESWGE